MEHFVKVVRKKNGERFKNCSLMTIVISVQRGINEYKLESWKKAIKNKTLARNTTPKSFYLKLTLTLHFMIKN